MSHRVRVVAFLVVLVSVVAVTTAYAIGAATGYQRRYGTTKTVTVADQQQGTALASGPRLVFRHTGVDDEYGHVAVVSLADPGGPRAFAEMVCDRVAATATVTSCLRTQRGVATTYSMTLYDEGWDELDHVGLPGIPSRTRLSPDGSLVASTTFVSGHTYQQVGFSTRTEIRDVGGRGYGDLEDFDLVLHGRSVRPQDRNIWGVTFADGDTFYATVGTGGRTYLVRGDLRARTLTSVADHVECPSLSPDGTRIGFKQATQRDGQTWWTPAVLDLGTGRRTVLAGETRDVDDQVAWLDDDTLLYGVPRDDEPGVTDVWALDTNAAAVPVLLVEQAWSPTVVGDLP